MIQRHPSERARRAVVQQMQALRAQGLTWAQIAQQLNIDPATCYRYRRRYNIPATPRISRQQERVAREFDEPLVATITGLRAIGYSWATVAGALDVSLVTLLNWRKRLGLPIDRHAQQSDPDWLDAAATQIKLATDDWLRGASGRREAE